MKELLYDKVSDARESCAGCHPLSKPTLLKKIDEALGFAFEVSAPQEIINSLNEARRIVSKSKTYYDRLPVDQVLSDVLNRMNRNEYPELEVLVI